MIENILSTDMAVHFSGLANFKKQLLENPKFGTDPVSLSCFFVLIFYRKI